MRPSACRRFVNLVSLASLKPFFVNFTFHFRLACLVMCHQYVQIIIPDTMCSWSRKKCSMLKASRKFKLANHIPHCHSNVSVLLTYVSDTTKAWSTPVLSQNHSLASDAIAAKRFSKQVWDKKTYRSPIVGFKHISGFWQNDKNTVTPWWFQMHFFGMLLSKCKRRFFLPPCKHMWTIQRETFHCMRIAHIQFHPWILTNIGTPYHHSWQKGCNLMWGFPTRICPANILLTSVVSVVLQQRIFLCRLAGAAGAWSKRLSWTTKFWSSQIFTASAPLDTTVRFVPPHSISNRRCLVVLWVFAVPMSGSNQFYGTNVARCGVPFSPKLGFQRCSVCFGKPNWRYTVRWPNPRST